MDDDRSAFVVHPQSGSSRSIGGETLRRSYITHIYAGRVQFDLQADLRKALSLLHQTGEATTTGLTRMLGRRHTQSTSATLARLAERGLVTKRGAMWSVTPEGVAALEPFVRFVPAHAPGALPSAERLRASLSDVPKTTSQLAQLAGMERTNAHKGLESLERAGLVLRVGGRPVRWRLPYCP